MLCRPSAFVAVLVVVAWGAVNCPEVDAQSYSLGRVLVVGATRLPAATVIRMTGLRPPTMVSAADIERARQRLLESGLFSGVGYGFKMVGYSLTVTFSVEEPPWDTRLQFDNFIWFADEELTRAVARVLPGFAGLGPTLPQTLLRVSKVLEGEVRKKGIEGTVSYTAGGGSGPNACLFRVDLPAGMPVCAVELEGVAAERLDGARASLALLVGQSYSRSFADRIVRANLLPFYGQQGYLKAAAGHLQATLAATASCSSGVVLTLPVIEGRQYTWSGTSWIGVGDVPVTELDGRLGLERGAVADTQLLEERIKAVKDRFVGEGYLAIRPAYATQCDDAAGTAVAQITVTRGPRIRLRTFDVQGPPPVMTDLLKADWAPPAGEYFNGLYINDYLKAARKKYPAVFREFTNVSVETKPVPNTPATVDIIVTFARH
jgi:outer membrane protein assembly factor BamA